MTRTPENWRYSVIKRYRSRATRFYYRSRNTEEAQAWLRVIFWFNALLNDNRCITPSGAIGLKDNSAIECIIQEEDEK